MKTEHEATFTNIEKDEVRKWLRAAGAVLIHAEMVYERYVFNPPPGVPGHVRIRKEDTTVTMTVKQKVEGSSLKGNHWKEAEVIIDDIEEGMILLKSLGCTDRAFQTILREKWILDDVEVMIDTWPFLESYVKVESKTMDKVQEITKKLCFVWGNARFVNATDLYMEKYGVTKEYVNNKTPRIVFDENNPFLITHE